MRSAWFRLRNSLAARLLFTYIAALLVTMACVAAVVWFSADEDAGVSARVQLEKLTEMLENRMQFDSGDPSGVSVTLPSEISWVFADFAADAKYAVLDRSGRTLVASGKDDLTPPGQTIAAATEFQTWVADGQTLLVRTQSVNHGTHTYYIRVAISTRFSHFVRFLTGQVKVANTVRLALCSVLLVTVAVYFTLRRVLKPLRQTSDAAAAIDTHNLSKRLATRNLPVEFLPVVEAFNLTLDRLEKGYNVQREFLASAAHELKTPLAVMRAQIELNAAPGPEALLPDLDFMARQVNQLLHLAEASETQNYTFERVDIRAVAEDVADYLRALAERRTVYVDVRSVAPSVIVQADRGASFMLLKNLVENAIQHSTAGAGVTVMIDTDRLCVRDEGPGISAAELPKLFERFWRGALRQNEGAGLGLSICAQIAAAHGWHLSANTGPGAEFVLVYSR